MYDVLIFQLYVNCIKYHSCDMNLILIAYCDSVLSDDPGGRVLLWIRLVSW